MVMFKRLPFQSSYKTLTTRIQRLFSEDTSKYKQGQEYRNERNKSIREYFYYVDHQGQLFLDDAKIKNFTSCFKEQHFLEFFFRNLRHNQTERYSDQFKYVSNCGIEKNYLKCNDLPFVATYLDQTNDTIQLNNIKSVYWSLKFLPENLVYDLETGRLYYLFEELKFNHFNKFSKGDNESELILKRRTQHFNKLPCKLCLVKSSISINLMKNLQEVDSDETVTFYEFDYKNKKYKLNLSDHGKFREDLQTHSSFIKKE